MLPEVIDRGLFPINSFPYLSRQTVAIGASRYA
jgi:hypothetical protein